ncbi:hypothetical protein NPIL_479711 [Nephila pilipes]|uniref:Uncharacterized protein n=1 Tax=Nephila pilipes TaxID=299642 RepID=A0A8X6PLN4_NEPPI|nr:hypothetical protein NPIL_479711 [Nephila pilipes]
MEVGSPVAYELPKSTESDVLRKSVAARKSLSPSKTTERPESRLSRESSSSADPVSTSASEFSRGLGSSTESMEPDEASLYRSTVRSDLRSGPTLRLQYGTTSYTKPIEEEMVTQFGIEGSSSTVEKGTFKDSGMSPEQMEVGSPVEHESLSASAKSDVSSKNEAPRKYLLSGRASDEPESRLSKVSSSSAEPTSSTSDISRGPESPTESMGPNDTPRFGTATKALHESIHKHLMFATESIISPIREEAITVFGTEESTDAEQKGLHESEKSPEQMKVGSPVECESPSEKSDIASKDLPSTAASALSESERSSAVVPTIKSEKQSSGSETIQDAATGESLSQIGKRCRMKAKLDKEKKSSRSDSSKLQKRARRHISGSPSESTEESTDSESNSETDSAEKK